VELRYNIGKKAMAAMLPLFFFATKERRGIYFLFIVA
jgi:hypothetical protein